MMPSRKLLAIVNIQIRPVLVKRVLQTAKARNMNIYRRQILLTWRVTGTYETREQSNSVYTVGTVSQKSTDDKYK